jgi:hypothetical protein
MMTQKVMVARTMTSCVALATVGVRRSATPKRRKPMWITPQKWHLPIFDDLEKPEVGKKQIEQQKP